MDVGTILIDVCQIQGQSVHFDELGDVFVRFVKIQGRILVFTHKISIKDIFIERLLVQISTFKLLNSPSQTKLIIISV